MLHHHNVAKSSQTLIGRTRNISIHVREYRNVNAHNIYNRNKPEKIMRKSMNNPTS